MEKDDHTGLWWKRSQGFSSASMIPAPTATGEAEAPRLSSLRTKRHIWEAGLMEEGTEQRAILRASSIQHPVPAQIRGFGPLGWAEPREGQLQNSRNKTTECSTGSWVFFSSKAHYWDNWQNLNLQTSEMFI